MPHVNDALEEDLAVLIELQEQLPEVGSQITDIRKVYNRGRDKVSLGVFLLVSPAGAYMRCPGEATNGVPGMAQYPCFATTPYHHLHAQCPGEQKVEDPRRE